MKNIPKALKKYRVPTLEFTPYLSGGTTSFEQKWVNSASFE